MTYSGRDRRGVLLGLAGAASLLELGPLVLLLHEGAGMIALLLAGLAYQIGNAAARPATFAGRIAIVGLATSSTVLLLLAPAGSGFWTAAIAPLSWALQAARRNVALDARGKPTTVQKRGARVIGFVAAAFVPAWIWIPAILISIAAAAPVISPATNSAKRAARGFGHPLEWTMLVHQTHYFSYAYAVPLLVAQPALGGLPFVGLWFACGWISYLSAETLWRRWPPQTAFIVGHLSLAVVLALLSISALSPWFTLVLWGLSGFGGGTVYGLTLLHKRQGLAPERLERAEDAGHLLGVLTAILTVYFLKLTAFLLPALGSAGATIAALALLVHIAIGARQQRRPPSATNS